MNMSSQNNVENSPGQLKSQMRGMKAELKKVIWPTKKELINYTVVVLVMCTVISLIVWLIDSGLNIVLSKIIG